MAGSNVKLQRAPLLQGMIALMPETSLFVCAQQMCTVAQHHMWSITVAIATCILHDLKLIYMMEQEVRLRRSRVWQWRSADLGLHITL